MFPRDLKHLGYFFSERTRGLFQYGERHFLRAQAIGGLVSRGNHTWPQRLQVRVGSLMGLFKFTKRTTEAIRSHTAGAVAPVGFAKLGPVNRIRDNAAAVAAAFLSSVQCDFSRSKHFRFGCHCRVPRFRLFLCFVKACQRLTFCASLRGCRFRHADVSSAGCDGADVAVVVPFEFNLDLPSAVILFVSRHCRVPLCHHAN